MSKHDVAISLDPKQPAPELRELTADELDAVSGGARPADERLSTMGADGTDRSNIV